MVSDVVFKNASRGDRVPEVELASAFESMDHQTILQTIVKKGELHLSAAERREFVEKKRLDIGWFHWLVSFSLSNSLELSRTLRSAHCSSSLISTPHACVRLPWWMDDHTA
jgi:Shwachman-Bodian-Diamond syndrome (SBDS) protein